MANFYCDFIGVVDEILGTERNLSIASGRNREKGDGFPRNEGAFEDDRSADEGEFPSSLTENQQLAFKPLRRRKGDR